MELGIRVKGSPELDAPKQIEIKLPRKKATMMTLLPTGKGGTAPTGGQPDGDGRPPEWDDPAAEFAAQEARDAGGGK